MTTAKIATAIAITQLRLRFGNTTIYPSIHPSMERNRSFAPLRSNMKSTEQSYQQQRLASPPVFFLRAADPIPMSGQQYIHIICLRVWGVSGWGLRLRKRKI